MDFQQESLISERGARGMGQQVRRGDVPGGSLPNDGQGSEVLAGAAGAPQGLVWLAEVDGPQGSAFWAAGPALGRGVHQVQQRGLLRVGAVLLR